MKDKFIKVRLSVGEYSQWLAASHGNLSQFVRLAVQEKINRGKEMFVPTVNNFVPTKTDIAPGIFDTRYGGWKILPVGTDKIGQNDEGVWMMWIVSPAGLKRSVTENEPEFDYFLKKEGIPKP